MHNRLSIVENEVFNKLMVIRSTTELEYIKTLEEDYGMAQYYDIFDNTEELKQFTQQMLASAVLLNKFVAPRLYSICAEIQAKLRFNEPIDFYVLSTPEQNAFSLNGFGLVPHIVCLNSALIQLASDDELRFAIGHEIGHLVYNHNKLDFIRKFLFKENGENPPAGLAITYYHCLHYAEISADRVGYLAMPDIRKVVNAIFKLHFGLPSESLNFQIEEYLKQLDRIKELGMGEFFCTHPNPMLRIQALLDFESSELAPIKKAGCITASELETRLKALLQMMEEHPKTEKETKIVEFLCAVGMFLIYDQESFEEKYELLFDQVYIYTTQPELYLNFKDHEDLQKRVKEVCKYYSTHKDDTLFELIRRGVALVLVDGRLDTVEKERLHEVAKLLDLATDTLNFIIAQVSEAILSPNNRTKVKRVL